MALQRRGHRVVLLTNPYFSPLAEKLGLPLVPLGTVEDYEEATAEPDLWNPYKVFSVIWRFVRQANRIVYDNIERLAEPGHTVLVGATLALGARIAQPDKQLIRGQHGWMILRLEFSCSDAQSATFRRS